MATNPYLPGLEPINTMNNPVWNPITQTFEYGKSAQASQPGLPGWDIYDKPGLPSGYPGTSGSLNKRYVDAGNVMNDASNFNIFGMSRANADIPTDQERFALERSGIMQGRPNMRDISGEVGEYGNTSGFDLSNMDMNNPDAAIGPIINFKDAPRKFGEPRMNNPRYGPIDMWRNQGGDETTRRFPGIFGMAQHMFQRPEAKQKEFDMYQQTKGPEGWGDIGGGYQGNIWGNNKLNVYDPASEQMILRDKNFDSAFGSESVEEMIAKKEAWARQRRAKGEEYLSTSLKNWLDEIDKKQGGPDGDPKGPAGPSTYGGPPTFNFDPKQASTAPTHMGAGPLHGVQQGGYMRSRYNQGGRVGILSIF